MASEATTCADISRSVPRLSAARLERSFVPPPALWGTGVPPGEVTARATIIHAIRHLGVHLGELRLTRTLLAGGT